MSCIRVLVLCSLIESVLSFYTSLSDSSILRLGLERPPMAGVRRNPTSPAARSLQCNSAPKKTTQNASPSAMPAPGRPFHLAFPVHDLDEARHFYGSIMGCEEGRCAPGKWIDFSLAGHQIVCHWVGKDYRAPEYYNPVDGDEVPVPHFGLCLDEASWFDLRKRLEEADTKFVVEPTLRFKGAPGEQWTMFFKDPSNNALEFKAMTNPGNLFAKYDVVS